MTNDIAPNYILPGKPQQNAYVERFNRSVRYEWLSQHPRMILHMCRTSRPNGFGNAITSANRPWRRDAETAAHRRSIGSISVSR
ncbi:integrase core domain-containing protein [Caballeronia sp. GAFFF2]|uniref:integrase core domain-containing protein n=1 Tax=Caballeronia sp. GAFFF2 TaxID=2921741 RepID=UPI0032EAAD8A